MPRIDHPAALHGEAGDAAPDADVAVAAQRSLEEEGVASGCLRLIEETEDAERRQQIAWELNRVTRAWALRDPKTTPGTSSLHAATVTERTRSGNLREVKTSGPPV